MKLNQIVLIFCLPALGLMSQSTPARAQEPAYGTGITVDGNPTDWNLDSDFFADMYNAGRPNSNWSGYAVLSTLYLRYNCETNLLCALVLDVTTDNHVPLQSADDAWIRIYDQGWSNNKLIDGNGAGNTTPRSFQWVRQIPGNPNSPVIGYEACAQLDQGLYPHIEAHLNVGGGTSSTGKHVQGYSIPMSILCQPGTVDAEELPRALALAPACPNPFNPATELTISLAETGLATLKVYDLSGREVATLLDGMAAAGEQHIRFQAGSLSSGVYFAVLQSGGAATTQKLLLVK